MNKVRLKSSFEEILGKDRNEFTEDVRKQRWEEWKACARKKKDGNETIEYWSDQTACVGCIHLIKEQSWCNAMGLPCTVNPILSFRMGIIGMACMGTGYEAMETQLELFDDVQ